MNAQKVVTHRARAYGMSRERDRKFKVQKPRGKQGALLTTALNTFYDHDIKAITAKEFYKLLPKKKHSDLSNILFRMTHIWKILKKKGSGANTTYSLVIPDKVEIYKVGHSFGVRRADHYKYL